MITTADGAIDVDGRSGPLGGPADTARLLELRSRAAVVLVGAGTAKGEGYGAPSRKDLRIGVVTRSCNLDFGTPLFSSGAGFVVTTTDAPEVPVDSMREGTAQIDFAAVIARLPEGLVHVEGGPTLNAALMEADLVDAINLTFTPHLTGARGPGISQAPHALRRFTLTDLRQVEGFAFARYERT